MDEHVELIDMIMSLWCWEGICSLAVLYHCCPPCVIMHIVKRGVCLIIADTIAVIMRGAQETTARNALLADMRTIKNHKQDRHLSLPTCVAAFVHALPLYFASAGYQQAR